MRIAVFTVVLFALASIGAARAEAPAQRPKAAAEHLPSQHPKAKPTLAELAAKGDAAAQYELGLAAQAKGKGARKGQSEALAWFTLSAGNGSKDAALGAARILEQRGDLALAAHWWYRAGELGDTAARSRLLDLYLDGKVPGIGGKAAAGWLATLANGGDSRAQMALGDLYEHGRGIPIDLALAQRWYLAAALDGDLEAMFRLGRLQLSLPAVWRAPGRETGKDGKWTGPFTAPLRLAARNRDSLDLGRQVIAAELGIEPKALQLYRPGMVEGEHWLGLAARYGHAEAQYLLGRTYVEGIDLPFDPVVGIRWLEAAAWQHNPRALVRLGDLAAEGQGFPAKDPVRAWVDYDLAAFLGTRSAEEARDRVGKTLNPHQMTRARQIALDLRDLGQ